MTNGTRTQTGVVRPYPRPGRWVEQAACRVVNPDVFYDRRPNFTAAARDICADCLVQAECLDYALACESLDPYGGHGIWGGLTGKERNRLRRQLNNDSTTQPQPQPQHLESA